MFKDVFNRRKPDPPTQNLRMDGVTSEVVYLVAEAITYGYRPEEMRDFTKFDDQWFYKLRPAQQREKLAEYFSDLAREDAKRRFNSQYDRMCSNYRSRQQGLTRKAEQDSPDTAP